MSAKFLEGFSGKFAEQWVATILTPAFVFWAGGCIATIQKIGWQAFSGWFFSLSEILQIVSLIGIFLAVTFSGFIIQRLDLTVLRLLEGYWHPCFNWLRNPLLQKQRHHRNQIKMRLRKLNNQGVAQLSLIEKTEHFQLSAQFSRIPVVEDLMPTRFGNLLRATERRPLRRYGLDAIIVWSRLWLLLPDSTRQDLTAARTDLNTAARIWLWSIFFILWFPISGAGWAVPAGLLVATYTYYIWILDAATTYADLIDAAFDVHRVSLYKSLRWQLPRNAEEEIELGQQLTRYLWHGDTSEQCTFTEPS